jgi:hypothetical protein
MTNALVNKNDGWATVPTSSSSLIRGARIRFADGHFYLGGSSEPLPPDLELVVMGAVTLWQSWRKGKPGEQRVTQPGQQHPDRAELPDQDQTQWEPGLGGTPADPWRDARFVYLADPRTAHAFTFTTESAGGRSAVGALKNQIANMRIAHPSAIPVVHLRSEPMKTRFGRKPKPLFAVVDWRRTDVTSPPADQSDGLSYRRQPSLDMNDEIPDSGGGTNG